MSPRGSSRTSTPPTEEIETAVPEAADLPETPASPPPPVHLFAQSPNGYGEPPPPYRVADKKEWIVCDEPGMEGFAIQVRTNITNAEQREVASHHDWIAGVYTREWEEIPVEDRDMTKAPRELERKQLAPFIYGWNAEGRDPKTGEWGLLPPPVEAGPEVFDSITDEMTTWMIRVVIVGYMVTGKVRRLKTRSTPTGDTSAEDQTPDTTD
jgi:hypothetical protein